LPFSGQCSIQQSSILQCKHPTVQPHPTVQQATTKFSIISATKISKKSATESSKKSAKNPAKIQQNPQNIIVIVIRIVIVIVIVICGCNL